ncbi:NAD(P)H-binding protein [Olivibacter sitiensis]|uniref:NAD(P)H-binding protein n=1 Tax=Olivibacter sitiensis TaxID=376470 RepID=UPI0003F9BAE2|nr:NAD(P)H-binding protein [Olivibacter sitiensis]
MKAIILGASGLVGSHLLPLLLASDSYDKVIAIVRKDLDTKHEKLQQVHATVDTLKEVADALVGDVVFSCIGTTKSKTPDLEEYYRIDHDYPLQLAAIALENGAQYFHLVSAMGADAHSRIFYSRMKGELERDILGLPFNGIHIYRPSLITGDRNEKRSLEDVSSTVMDFINPVLVGPLKKYQSIEAEIIAKAMYNKSVQKIDGNHIYLSDQIKELA